jgi:hypothetical protein
VDVDVPDDEFELPEHAPSTVTAVSIVRNDLAGHNAEMEGLRQFMVISSCLDFFYTKLHEPNCMNHTKSVPLAMPKLCHESKHIHGATPVRVISKTMQKTLLCDCIGILQRTPLACGNCEDHASWCCAGIFPVHGISSLKSSVNFDA